LSESGGAGVYGEEAEASRVCAWGVWGGGGGEVWGEGGNGRADGAAHGRSVETVERRGEEATWRFARRSSWRSGTVGCVFTGLWMM